VVIGFLIAIQIQLIAIKRARTGKPFGRLLTVMRFHKTGKAEVLKEAKKDAI